MSFDRARTCALAALLIVSAGYVSIFRPQEAALDERFSQLDAARAKLDRSLALARDIPALEGNRRALQSEFGRIHVNDHRAGTVDRFLRTVAGVSAHDRVAVESVSGSVLQRFAAPPRPAPASLLEEVPLDLTLRGDYGDVIRAVRDINSEDPVARVTLASLGDADRRLGGRPLLNAAFHVTLLHEPDPLVIHDLSTP